jgi:hypothetical protein
MPSECRHGKIFDWGDFGGEDFAPETCDECDDSSVNVFRVREMLPVLRALKPFVVGRMGEKTNGSSSRRRELWFDRVMDGLEVVLRKAGDE